MPLGGDRGRKGFWEVRLLGFIDKTQDLWAIWPAGRRGDCSEQAC